MKKLINKIQIIFVTMLIVQLFIGCSESDSANRKQRILYIQNFHNANWINNINAIYDIMPIVESDKISNTTILCNLTISYINLCIEDSLNKQLYKPLIYTNYAKSLIVNPIKSKEIYDLELGNVRNVLVKLDANYKNEVVSYANMLADDDIQIEAWRSLEKLIWSYGFQSKIKITTELNELLNYDLVTESEDLAKLYSKITVAYVNCAIKEYTNSQLYFFNIAKYFRLAITTDNEIARNIFEDASDDVKYILSLFEKCL